jgi:hypothetical protein
VKERSQSLTLLLQLSNYPLKNNGKEGNSPDSSSPRKKVDEKETGKFP